MKISKIKDVTNEIAILTSMNDKNKSHEIT